VFYKAILQATFRYFLLSENDKFREKGTVKSEKIIAQKETTTFFKKIVVSFGLSERTCPSADGAVVGSDCHRQSFTSDPSSPPDKIKKHSQYFVLTALFWSE